MKARDLRTAESNHPPIGYMHQCMQLACLMGDVQEVESVAAIEGYNLEHLILGEATDAFSCCGEPARRHPSAA